MVKLYSTPEESSLKCLDYNVVYDNEPDVVYTYKLMEDFLNGDLKLV